MWPEDGQSLGLSIVGGHHIIKRLKNGEELKGIFIKQVLPNSPAAKTQCLKTGDKILEVRLRRHLRCRISPTLSYLFCVSVWGCAGVRCRPANCKSRGSSQRHQISSKPRCLHRPEPDDNAPGTNTFNHSHICTYTVSILNVNCVYVSACVSDGSQLQ